MARVFEWFWGINKIVDYLIFFQKRRTYENC